MNSSHNLRNRLIRFRGPRIPRLRREPDPSAWNVVRAWAAHLYTSLGLVAAFSAIVAVADGRARDAFFMLGLAAVIDGTDGVLARKWDVKRWAPGFDGRKLDDIIDYLTYVLIPVFFAFRFELVSGPWTPVLFIVLIAAAYGFCQTVAKTEDGFYTGFPNYWNAVVLYLYFFRYPPVVAGLLLLVFAALVFVPIRYMSLNETPMYRAFNRVTLSLWMLILAAIMLSDVPDLRLVYLSLLFPACYTGLSLSLHARARLVEGEGDVAST